MLSINWNLDVKQILIIVLLVVLLIWLVISQISNNNLKNQLNEARKENITLVDSLNFVNNEHLKKIKTYEAEIANLKVERDSLYKVKNKIIIKREELIISKDASEASDLLKSNLEKWRK